MPGIEFSEPVIATTINYWSRVVPEDKREDFAAAMRADFERALEAGEKDLTYGPIEIPPDTDDRKRQQAIQAAPLRCSLEFAIALTEIGIDPKSFPGHYDTFIDLKEQRVYLVDRTPGVPFSQKYTPAEPESFGTEAEKRFADMKGRNFDFGDAQFSTKPNPQIETGEKRSIAAAIGAAWQAGMQKIGLGK